MTNVLETYVHLYGILFVINIIGFYLIYRYFKKRKKK